MDGSLKGSDNTALPRHGSVARTGDASLGGKSGAPEGTQSPPHSVLDELSDTFASARRIISDFLELLSLETRRAGLTLVWMVACGAVAAILVVTRMVGFYGRNGVAGRFSWHPMGDCGNCDLASQLLAAAIMTSV